MLKISIIKVMGSDDSPIYIMGFYKPGKMVFILKQAPELKDWKHQLDTQ